MLFDSNSLFVYVSFYKNYTTSNSISIKRNEWPQRNWKKHKGIVIFLSNGLIALVPLLHISVVRSIYLLEREGEEQKIRKSEDVQKKTETAGGRRVTWKLTGKTTKNQRGKNEKQRGGGGNPGGTRVNSFGLCCGISPLRVCIICMYVYVRGYIPEKSQKYI